MQLTGQKLGNITVPKNSCRVNPFATRRPWRWTEELVQNKQNKTPDPFIPLCKDVLYHHSQLYLSEDMLRFLAVQLERGKRKNFYIAAEARSSCCAFPLLFPVGEIPVAQA